MLEFANGMQARIGRRTPARRAQPARLHPTVSSLALRRRRAHSPPLWCSSSVVQSSSDRPFGLGDPKSVGSERLLGLLESHHGNDAQWRENSDGHDGKSERRDHRGSGGVGIGHQLPESRALSPGWRLSFDRIHKTNPFVRFVRGVPAAGRPWFRSLPRFLEANGIRFMGYNRPNRSQL